MHRFLQLCVAGITALAFTSLAKGQTMDRTSLITARDYDVRMMLNGADITAKTPIVAVKYNADGTGERTLRDGKVVTGSWRFINTQQTQIEVQGPDGTSRWVIVELSPTMYRKVNIDSGVEFIHLPKTK
jgi:hypothetical protein